MGGKPGAVGREEVGKEEERRRTKKKVEATGIRRNKGASKPELEWERGPGYICPDGHDETSATANRQSEKRAARGAGRRRWRGEGGPSEEQLAPAGVHHLPQNAA